MNRTILQTRWLVAAAILLLPACESSLPAGSTAARQSAASARTKTSSGTSASAMLTVQGESVGANEIWLPYMDELAAKARKSSPGDMEEYLNRRSGELITDKLTEMLLYQKAKLRITAPMEKKIDEYVDADLRKRVTARYDGVQRRMERELESQGWSLDGYREILRRSIIISSYLEDEIRPHVAEPTRAELMEAFRQAEGSLRRPPRRSMSLIDVRVARFLPEGSEPSQAQREDAHRQAKDQITQAHAELKNGMPFAEAAKKYSHASNAADGGSWGFVNPESVQDRFAPALARLQTLQPGQVSEVIETPDSFFLVKCDELDPGSKPDFQTVQPELREQLFARSYNKAIADEVADLRKNSRIEAEQLETFHVAVVAAAREAAARMKASP